jgi:hypothetical protein
MVELPLSGQLVVTLGADVPTGLDAVADPAATLRVCQKKYKKRNKKQRTTGLEP